jgi:tubulin beta
MDTKLYKVLCGEKGIGGDGEYCGDIDAQLGRIIALFHGASGGKYVPRAELFDLEPGVNSAPRNAGTGSNWAKVLMSAKRGLSHWD